MADVFHPFFPIHLQRVFWWQQISSPKMFIWRRLANPKSVKISIFARFKTSLSKLPTPIPQKSPLLKEIPVYDIIDFSVARQSSGLLPIYRQFKNGNRTVTVIRKITNKDDFVKKISTFIAPERIKKKLGSVEINGDFLLPLRQFLTQQKL